MRNKSFILILLFCIVNIYSQEYNGEFFKYALGTEYDYIVKGEGLSGFIFDETSRVNYIDVVNEDIFGFYVKFRYIFRTDLKFRETNTLTTCFSEREGHKSILINLHPQHNSEDIGIEYYIDNYEEVAYYRNLFYNIASYYNEIYGTNKLIEIGNDYGRRKIYSFGVSQNGESISFRMSFGIYANDNYYVVINLYMRNDVDEGR